jgi:hypothetical protein
MNAALRLVFSDTCKGQQVEGHCLIRVNRDEWAQRPLQCRPFGLMTCMLHADTDQHSVH